MRLAGGIILSPDGKFAGLRAENLLRFGQVRPYVTIVEPDIRGKTDDNREIVRIKLNQFYEGAIVSQRLFGYAEHPPNITYRQEKVGKIL